jgi:hypothetical protein
MVARSGSNEKKFEKNNCTKSRFHAFLARSVVFLLHQTACNNNEYMYMSEERGGWSKWR